MARARGEGVVTQRVSREVQQGGAAVHRLEARLVAGCPKAETPDWGERCFAYFPQLLEPPRRPVPGDAEAG